MLEVKVTDKNGNIIKDADVVLRLNGSIYHSGLIPKTNSQGIVRYPLAEGSYQVAAFKDGYIPLANTVDMKTGTSQSIVFQLEHDSMIETDLSVDKLTYDEMVKNGIDVDANRTVYKYTLELKYEKTEMPTLEH